MIFSASWCTACRSNEELVYPAPALRPCHEKFVWLHLDIERLAAQPLMRKYRVRELPDLVFLNPDGSSIGRIHGALTVPALTAILDQILTERSS